MKPISMMSVRQTLSCSVNARCSKGIREVSGDMEMTKALAKKLILLGYTNINPQLRMPKKLWHYCEICHTHLADCITTHDENGENKKHYFCILCLVEAGEL